MHKQRQKLEHLEIIVSGRRVSEPPRVYDKIHVEYKVKGKDLKEKAVQRAIRSQEKYCSVAATLKNQSRHSLPLRDTTNINTLAKQTHKRIRGEIQMSTAFDKIADDRQLQDHWLRRLIAGIIDSVIIGIISSILSVIFSLPSLLFGGVFVLGAFPLLSGILLFLYAMFMEANRGATLGKLAMNLKVTTTDGKLPKADKTVIRNVSKVYPLLWLIDTLIGMATQGDPHQKYSDRWVGTTVTSTIANNMLLQPSQPSQPAQPTPPTTQA